MSLRDLYSCEQEVRWDECNLIKIECSSCFITNGGFCVFELCYFNLSRVQVYRNRIRMNILALSLMALFVYRSPLLSSDHLWFLLCL